MGKGKIRPSIRLLGSKYIWKEFRSYSLRFNLRTDFGIVISTHLKALKGCVHGPQEWPWWRRIAFAFHPLTGVHPPSTGYRLWIYTRAGGRTIDVFFDRRDLSWLS